MAMRVSELMAVPSLDLRVVVDGDLERVIRWVHTTELADPTRYLQGGEVILTTGVRRDAGTTSTGFVAPLRQSDVAALGYGLPQPDAVVPDDLVSACAAARLPLFAVPFEVPFIAVSRAFVDRVYGQREDALRERVLRNDRLVHAAGHGAGLEGILAVLDPRLQAWMLWPGPARDCGQRRGGRRGRAVCPGDRARPDRAGVCERLAGVPDRRRRPDGGPSGGGRGQRGPGPRRPRRRRPDAAVPRPRACPGCRRCAKTNAGSRPSSST